MGKIGIYLPALYPSRETFLRAVTVCREMEIDFLEIGFPFSDPIADGEVLEKAVHKVLEHHTADDITEGVRAARAVFKGKTYVMTYANIIRSTGAARFMRSVGPLSGVILADLPLREMDRFEKDTQTSSLNLIRFLTPESREEDMAAALKGARDFIYFVSKRGTTGRGFHLDDETREKVARVRGKGIDVFIGFGIRGKTDVDLACTVADGAIIGTKAVQELERGIDAFRVFLASLRKPGEMSEVG